MLGLYVLVKAIFNAYTLFMAITTKILRAQIALMKNLTNSCDLDTARNGQAMMGTLMANTGKSKVLYQPIVFKNFLAEWIAPKYQKFDGVILYLHGGGYVAGDIDYARGFGTILASKESIKVFTAAYRLAPENPYPAAIDDALEAYDYLIKTGYNANQIILCGESAGGGLIFSLCLKLRLRRKPLPRGLIAISPWLDLTQSSTSMEFNRDKDPSLTPERLEYFAKAYTEDGQNVYDRKDPFISPLFATFDKFPQSLIFVGGDEILLDDAVEVHKALITAKQKSKLFISPDMWHAYVLYGVKETKKDFDQIDKFLTELLGDAK